jgi:hypothetical protein
MLRIAADCRLRHNALEVIPQGGVDANVDRKGNNEKLR